MKLGLGDTLPEESAAQTTDAIVAVLNRWAEADMARLRADHAALTADLADIDLVTVSVIGLGGRLTQITIPRRRYGEGPRAQRHRSDPAPWQ